MGIEEAFFDAVAADFAPLPISYPGVNFTPPPTGTWIEVDIFPNEPANQPLRGRGVDQGIMQITLCARPGQGIVGINNASNAILAAYPKNRRFSTGHRIISDPYKLSRIDEPDKIMLPVSMTYSA